jgi:hypothetical protein
LLGRPEKAHWRPGSTDYSARHRPIGPEDQPHFSGSAEISENRSAELDRRLEEWEAEQRALREGPEPKLALPAGGPPGEAPDASAAERIDLDAWQADLDRREADLRRRELELREQELDQRDSKLGES